MEGTWYVPSEKKVTSSGGLTKKSAMQRVRIDFINLRYQEPHLSLAAQNTVLPLSLADCNKPSKINFTSDVFSQTLSWIDYGKF